MKLKYCVIPLCLSAALLLSACGLPANLEIVQGTPVTDPNYIPTSTQEAASMNPNDTAAQAQASAESSHSALSETSANASQTPEASTEPSGTSGENQTSSSQTRPASQDMQDASQAAAASGGASAVSTPAAPASEAGSATTIHGALSVDGASLVDQNGEPYQLYGMSTHGIAWFPQFVNKDAFRTLRDDWNTNCIRLAMYSGENNGYCTGGNKEDLKNLIHNGVSYATELGMYVIIDWHVLGDQDPNVYKSEAIAFFEEMSSAYADYTNVIYEICNEPNGYATWDSVKSYAEEVIPVIRENDSDAVILVGTPTWSQNIDQAAANPLDFDNIMYTFHFYAGTHKDSLRERLDTCVSNGLPVFVSEFGICDASGNGSLDYDSAAKWMDLIEEYHISFCMWNLANKNESSSVFKGSCQRTSDWTEDDLNDSGKWFRDYCRNK